MVRQHRRVVFIQSPWKVYRSSHQLMPTALKKAVNTSTLSDDDRCALANHICDQLMSKFEYLFAGLEQNVADALFEEMREMDEEDAMARHFNVMRALKLQGSALRAQFADMFATAWQSMLDGYPLPELPEPGALVCERLERYSRGIDAKYRVLIEDVDAKLLGLLQQEVLDNPLASERLFVMFWNSVAQLELTHEERVLMVPLFYRFVMDRYGQILVIPAQVLADT